MDEPSIVTGKDEGRKKRRIPWERKGKRTLPRVAVLLESPTASHFPPLHKTHTHTLDSI